MSLFAELTQGVNAIRPGRTTMRNFDLPLFVAAGTLLCLGLLMVYSASIALADGPLFSQMSRYSFVTRQAVFYGGWPGFVLIGVANTPVSCAAIDLAFVRIYWILVGAGVCAWHWLRGKWCESLD